MAKCIYCNLEKDKKDLSHEHVLPRAIGGVLEPINPFTINDVCERCNNISGFFIDAPFTKSWLINNYRASNVAKYATITPKTILPLVYMGVMKDLTFEGKICENYLGPAGDLIYHFHKPYDEKLDNPTIIGLPPHLKRKKLDEGFAFIFIRSDNPVWLPTVVFSFINNFKQSILYLGNGPTPKIPNSNFQDIPIEFTELHNKLLSIMGEVHEMNVTMDIDTENRFLAKLALGLGCIFLNDSFRFSNDAAMLRKFMWAKDKKERDKIPVKGSSFFSSGKMKDIDKFLKWEGGHVINLMTFGNSLALYTNFYGIGGNLIQITNDKTHWEGKINESLLFIVMPEMQKFVGPINMVELLAHQNSDYKNTQILELEKQIALIPPLPRFLEERKGGTQLIV